MSATRNTTTAPREKLTITPMRPLNIFVVHSSDVPTDHLPNGEGWIVYNYLKGLTQRGHTIHLAVPQVEMRGALPPRVHLHLLPEGERSGVAGRLLYMRAIRELLARLSRSVRFDIAQQFTPVQTGLSLSLLGSGIPLVLGPYSGYWPTDAAGPPQRERLVPRIKRALRDGIASFQQRQASALTITCPAAIDRIALWSARVPVHVVSPGIEIESFPERAGVPSQPSILFLAHVVYRKGIHTLLDAFERVAIAVPDCRLEIWGGGAEAAVIGQRVLQSRFRNRIHVGGWAPRDKVSELMCAHSVYCMPSHGEPFGMTLLEAMASGVPIVSTDSGGPPHIVHREGGRLVPMRNAEALADALIEILLNPALQRSMGAYNRKRAEQAFGWNQSFDELESVYRQVLNESAGRSGAQECKA